MNLEELEQCLRDYGLIVELIYMPAKYVVYVRTNDTFWYMTNSSVESMEQATMNALLELVSEPIEVFEITTDPNEVHV